MIISILLYGQLNCVVRGDVGLFFNGRFLPLFPPTKNPTLVLEIFSLLSHNMGIPVFECSD